MIDREPCGQLLMKTLIRVVLFVVLSLPPGVLALELSEVEDGHLVSLLNNFELLSEVKELPYAIRVLRLRGEGECDGTPQSCPRATLYIAVSTIDEAPDQKLYRLPEAFGWTFVRWKALPKHDGMESFAVLEVVRQDISKAYPQEWWSEIELEVAVNPWKGYLKGPGLQSR